MLLPTAAHTLAPLLDDTIVLHLTTSFHSYLLSTPTPFFPSSSSAFYHLIDSITLRDILLRFICHTLGGMPFRWRDHLSSDIPLLPFLNTIEAFLPEVLDTLPKGTVDLDIKEEILKEARALRVSALRPPSLISDKEEWSSVGGGVSTEEEGEGEREKGRRGGLNVRRMEGMRRKGSMLSVVEEGGRRLMKRASLLRFGRGGNE